MKIKYTATYEIDVKDDWYPEGYTREDILNVEREQAVDVLLYNIENGNADVQVESVD